MVWLSSWMPLTEGEGETVSLKYGTIKLTCFIMYCLKHGESAVHAIMLRGVWSIETTPRVPLLRIQQVPFRVLIDLLCFASYCLVRKAKTITIITCCAVLREPPRKLCCMTDTPHWRCLWFALAKYNKMYIYNFKLHDTHVKWNVESDDLIFPWITRRHVWLQWIRHVEVIVHNGPIVSVLHIKLGTPLPGVRDMWSCDSHMIIKPQHIFVEFSNWFSD